MRKQCIIMYNHNTSYIWFCITNSKVVIHFGKIGNTF